jgi:hypothetical protein
MSIQILNTRKTQRDITIVPLFLLLLPVLLAACKHPLIVIGNGDIVDLNSSGHGCTLEQFQASDPACTENEVVGDYAVNYEGRPRPGWRFARWDGVCQKERSIAPHCAIEIPAAGVSWWDAQNSGPSPATTAVFYKNPSLDALTENNAAIWSVSTDSGNISVADANTIVHDGDGSIRISTDSGFDSWARVPRDSNAAWDLSSMAFVRFWVYAQNANFGFQGNSPWVRLGTSDIDYIELHPTFDALNNARDEWHEFVIPIVGDDTWKKTHVGSPSLSNINYVEIHMDTWGFGFKAWLDGLGFLSITDISRRHEVLRLFETWQFTPPLTATTEIGEIDIPTSSISNWVSSQPSIASVSASGEIVANVAGNTTISAQYGGIAIKQPVEVVAPVLAHQHEAIPAELAQPAEGALWEIPVLILRYLPTADGINLDTRVASDFHSLGEISLADMITKIDGFDPDIKFMLQEGSRFRGYNSPDAPPSLGYRVVEYITVYEPLPPGKFRFRDSLGNATHFTDYHGMFERFGVEAIVNELGVKEIWMWNGGVDASFPVYDPEYHTPLVFNSDWESNMSSPSSPDISNSNRDPTDLPIYDHTYVIYSQNIRRSQAEAVHNHGHQLESILSHINQSTEGNTELFWQDFVGMDENGTWQTGRAGDTHHPPNAEHDYDYLNDNIIESDIEDWRPDGSGETVLMNKDRWGDILYPWPGGTDGMTQRIESQWYIYWMQNMPGRSNQIPRGNDVMSNWWSFTGAWDESIEQGQGLSESP